MKWLVVVMLLVAATAQAEIYRWRDGRGTTHYTNREDEIPARYRSRATVLNLGLPPVTGAEASPAAVLPPSSPAVPHAVSPPAPPSAPPVATSHQNSPPRTVPSSRSRSRRDRSASEE